MTYYELLQVAPDASTEVIHEVWRILMRRYHPDNRQTGDAEKAWRINEAHEVLMDPQKRAEYDQSLRNPAAGPAQAPTHEWERAYPNAYMGQSIENIITNAAVDIGSEFIRSAMAQASPALRKLFEEALRRQGKPL